MADRALLYCRLSDPGDKNAPTLDSQEVLLRDYCAKKGYEVVAVLRESYTGAVLRDRPQIREALTLLEHSAADVFVVRDVDRLVREQWALAVFLDLVRARGARVEFALEEFEETPVGKLILSVKAFAAEYEREKIKWRTVTGKRRRLETGKLHSSGVEKFGFRRDKEKGVRHVHENEAAIVAQMYAWVADEGLSERGVQRRLIERGIPPPATGKVELNRAVTWSKSQIHRMLTDPSYKGEEVGWRWVVPSYGKSPVARPRDEWIHLPEGTTPAIVPPETWQKVQDQLKANTGTQARNERRPILLRGRIKCLECGLAMRAELDVRHSKIDGRETSRKTIYRCSSRETPGRKCSGSQVLGEWIDGMVWRRVARYISRGGTAVATGGTPAAAPDQTIEIRRRLTKLQAEHRNYVRLYGDATNDRERDAARREMTRVDALIEAAESSLAAARTTAQAHTVESAAALERQRYISSVRGRVDALTFEEQTHALAWLQVIVHASGRHYRLDAAEPL